MPLGKAFAPFTIPLFYRFIEFEDPLNSGLIGCLANIVFGVSCKVDVDYNRTFNLNFTFGRMQLNVPWIEEAIKFISMKEGIEGLSGILDYHFEIHFGLDIASASAMMIATLAALRKALNFNLKPIDLILLSHELELKFKIGFGSTYSQALGGIAIFYTPSVPSKAKYSKFSFPNDLRIVLAGNPMKDFPRYNSQSAFNQTFDLNSINSFNDLIYTSRRFYESVAHISPRLKGLMNEISKLNILSCGFGFLGNVIYILVYSDMLIDTISLLLDFFPIENIFVCEFDPIGVRVYL